MSATTSGSVTIRWKRLAALVGLCAALLLLADLMTRRAAVDLRVQFADGTPARCVALSLDGVVVHPLQGSGAVVAVYVPGTDAAGHWRSRRRDYSGIYRVAVYDDDAWRKPRWSHTFWHWAGSTAPRTLTLPFDQAAISRLPNC